MKFRNIVKHNKIKAAEQPTTPKPTTTLPDNMTWAWDPKANQWIAVMKDNPVVTPPTYNPNNITNTSNYTSTTYTPIKAANKEKTMQEYEDNGCDTTNLMKACQHIYYGFYDEIKNKWSPEKLLNYMEKRLDNAKNNPDEAKFEKNWATSRFPEAIELVKQFIENCNSKKEIKSKNIKSSSRALSVLPRLLDKVWYDYDEEDAGRYAQIGSWEIGLGGYDTGYEVSYQGTPIFSITEDNRFKPYFSNDRLQDEFGFSYSDIERALKKHRDLVDIKMIDASKNNEYWGDDISNHNNEYALITVTNPGYEIINIDYNNDYDTAIEMQDSKFNEDHKNSELTFLFQIKDGHLFSVDNDSSGYIKDGELIINDSKNFNKKSTLIDSLNQFLDGDKYSREIKIEKGLISDGLIKLAGINPIRGPKYSITDKGLNLLKQAAQEEYDFEKDYIKARKSYLLDGISESEFKTGAPESQGQMPKFSIFEKDGSELAQIEAKNSTDAKAKFIMENPEYEGSQSIQVKEIDSAYGETTTQGLDFPNQSVSPSTDVKVNPNGWVNMASNDNIDKFASMKKKANGPFEFEAPSDTGIIIDNKELLIELISKKLGVQLDPEKEEFDYSIWYKLRSSIKWEIEFETRDYGIKYIKIYVPDQTVSIDVEYTPENEQAPLQKSKYFSIEYPLKDVEVEMKQTETFDSIWMKELEVDSYGYCKATF